MTVFDRFGPSLVFLGCFWWFWVAYQKYHIRRTTWLAPSPPSKIKAPCHFSLSQGKNPSLSEIPYQSPKKCLKTQITTFSILKFSPKAKNTPVLTIFTLILPFVASSCSLFHCLSFTVTIPLTPLSSSRFRLFEDSTGWDISAIVVYRPHPLAFWSSTGYCQISRFHKLPYPKFHKNDLFWSFFLGLFWFFKVFFCDNCFGLLCSTFTIHHFSFTISFISAWFLLSFFLSFLQIWFRIPTLSDYVYCIWVRIFLVALKFF